MKKLTSLEKDLLKVLKKHQANYYQIGNAMKTVRRELESELFFNKLKRMKKAFIRPTINQYQDYFKAYDQEKDPQFKTAALFTYGTGVRVGELAQIKISDLDFERKTVKVVGEKTGKERIILFPDILTEGLKTHIRYSKNKVYLFEHEGKPYSTRRFQQVTKKCRERAGIFTRLTPHTGRHELITILTENNWASGVLRQQSGHNSDLSLKEYQHTNNLINLRPEYQKAINGFFQAVL